MHPPGTETESLRGWITKVPPFSWDLMGPYLPPLLVKTTLVVHLVLLWWSGNHKISVLFLTLHWRPNDRLTKGVPRFRVQSLLHLVYPSVGQVALFLVDLGRCWSELCLGRMGWRSCGNFHTIGLVLGAIGPIDHYNPIKQSLNLLTTWAEPSDLCLYV